MRRVAVVSVREFVWILRFAFNEEAIWLIIGLLQLIALLPLLVAEPRESRLWEGVTHRLPIHIINIVFADLDSRFAEDR